MARPPAKHLTLPQPIWGVNILTDKDLRSDPATRQPLGARARSRGSLPPVRILIDYRPALRERTGVGEYAHQMLRALASSPPEVRSGEQLALWTSSWADRPDRTATAELADVAIIDRRIPVRALNWMWHRLEWPPIEWLAGPVDVVHGASPLLIPARRAAQVVTLHDLFFLHHPDQTWAEIQRDYPVLVRDHVTRADAVVTPSQYTAGLIAGELGVAPDRIAVCPPGAPVWRSLGPDRLLPANGYILFVGTLEPRKNVGGLLRAYRRLVARHPEAPRLVLAGRATAGAETQLADLGSLAGRVEHRGYVLTEQREALYGGAALVVLPSFDEGFGLPVLEAMSAGIPVIISNRDSLPEVAGGAAGALIDPEDDEGLAEAMWRATADAGWARELAARGRRRAADFDWARTASTLRETYRRAWVRRQKRS